MVLHDRPHPRGSMVVGSRGRVLLDACDGWRPYGGGTAASTFAAALTTWYKRRYSFAMSLALEITSVNYGELEFWFASLKVIAIVGLIILGIILSSEGSREHRLFPGFWTAFMKSGFSFVCSPELMITVAATTRFNYRLAAFYIIGSHIFVIAAYDDPKLIPFVIEHWYKGLNHVVNASILTSVWSAGKSWVYAGSQILYSLTCEGHAPKVLATCNNKGVPYGAVICTRAAGLLAFLNASSSGAQCLHRFRAALKFHDVLHTITFRTPLQPYVSYHALIAVVLLTLTNGYAIFFPVQFTAASFLVSCIIVVIFLVRYLGRKLWYHTPWCDKVSELGAFSGKEEIERE
ncbi:amino acid permease-domain-containing protein [Aspergillus leporis]|uniref:Amino acid permease-domain-containing protein n=1 Tax=Aspergillus leporis TaxID=41062 RepID=A0A5N5WZT3_9EURO|nr:amino acid permease-domain-containing protein [Aspergillus leporis]